MTAKVARDLRAKYNAGGNAIIPNSFQCPNYFVDTLMYYLTPEENVVLFFAIRRILGFQENILNRKDKISLSQFTDGLVSHKDGTILSNGCGLGMQTVRNALGALEQYKILIPTTEKASNEGQEYWLQDDERAIDMVGLEERLSKSKAIHYAKTQKATIASLKNRGVTCDVTPEKNEGVTSHVIEGVTSHVIEGVTSHVNTKHMETQGNPLSCAPEISKSEMQTLIDSANKTLDAILEAARLSAGKSWTKLPEPYHIWGKAVCAATGLEYTKRQFHEWTTTFEDWMAQHCQPTDVLEAMKQIEAEGKAGWISSPSTMKHWVIGRKTARLAKERQQQQNSLPQAEPEPMPAWLEKEYADVQSS